MNLSSSPERVTDPLRSRGVNVHLRYSPASGAGEFSNPFELGRSWTKAQGKIKPDSGNGAV